MLRAGGWLARRTCMAKILVAVLAAGGHSPESSTPIYLERHQTFEVPDVSQLAALPTTEENIEGHDD